MKILGIESSCDDTSVALLDCSQKGCFVIREKIASQINLHKKYGGVVPEIAGRAHAEKIVPLIEEILKGQPKPRAIAVTAGPGLITGLLVGVQAAQTLSYALKIPLIPVNHIEGHIYSVEIEAKKKISFPALCLIVSGGHTELILMKNHGQQKIIGATKDDAAGECFDKVAKLLGLPYPGGPQISKLAASGNAGAIIFPRPMLNDANFDFSFAGLKTSALYWLRDNQLKNINDFCASFEQAIIDVLVKKTLRAIKKYHPKTVIMAGGVSANRKLRRTLEKEIQIQFPLADFRIPQTEYCMDNAAMIAAAGYHHAVKKDFTPWNKIKADPNWKLF